MTPDGGQPPGGQNLRKRHGFEFRFAVGEVPAQMVIPGSAEQAGKIGTDKVHACQRSPSTEAADSCDRVAPSVSAQCRDGHASSLLLAGADVPHRGYLFTCLTAGARPGSVEVLGGALSLRLSCDWWRDSHMACVSVVHRGARGPRVRRSRPARSGLAAEPRGRRAGSGGGAYPPASASSSCPATASGSGTAA